MAALLGRALAGRRAGEATLVWHDAGLSAPVTFDVRSDAFAHGGPIPARYAAVGQNLSPPLAWSGVPDGAAEFVLIVEDRDVPLRRPIVHAVATGIPPGAHGLAEGDLNAGRPFGSRAGSFRRVGYSGPRPIPGHGVHTYAFQLFALDVPLTAERRLAVPGRPTEVVAMVRGHVLARGRIDGTYVR